MADDRLAAPVRDVADLRDVLAHGGRPTAQHRVGVEHEKIGVLPDGSAPTYPAAIQPLLEHLAAGGNGWRRVDEDGHIIALQRGGASVTLEPGGQLEFSDLPQPTAAAAAAAVAVHLAEVEPLAAARDVTFLAAGFRPFGTLDDVPWMPKGRYVVMRAYLPTRGRHGHEMMKRTATVQANLDFLDEADCADKLRTAMGLSPLIGALWANSPLVDGKPSGFQTYRSQCWLDTDDDRCGLLPFVFHPDAPTRLFDDYTEWALDVPLFFVRRGGHYRPVPAPLTFRRFLAEGFEDERATVADWELHLSTLFPEVRLRPHLEVRSADAGTRAMVNALPAFYRGLLYDDEARRAAWSLVEDWTWDERQTLRLELPAAGLRATVRGTPILDRCRQLVAIARAGLTRLGDDEPRLIDPVAAIAESGRSCADEILDAHRECGGDPRRLIPRLRL